jgi:pyruvate formate lyase activating enzyme
MRIGGYIPLSLVDYPGEPAITVFTVGCNLRCPFCHNSGLVVKVKELESKVEILQFLRQRKNILDYLCISGGEPTIQPGLHAFIRDIRSMGYHIKLDTNGSKPEVLERLLTGDLPDYIAVDVKSSPSRYRFSTGGGLDFNTVLRSIKTVKASRVAYELRTTAVPGIVSLEDLEIIAKILMPVKRYVLQQFQPRRTLDPAFEYVTPYLPEWFEKAKAILERAAEEVIIRGV